MQIVFIEDGRHYIGSDAWVRIAKHLDGAWSLLQAFAAVPRPLRELTYRVIAHNRYHWFGKRDSCEFANRDAENRLIR
jgi:predicted DCC family thiol-disulfide oxidoreductase YuxK